MPTIVDVAKEAGVSFKTVSRVFSGEAGVRPATREKVREAAKRIGYQVNSAARALRTKAPRRVALLLNNPSRSYSESTQIGALLAAQAQGVQICVLESLDALKAEANLLGVIACPPLANAPELIAYMKEAALPFVRVGAERVSQAGDKIGIDDRAAAQEMTEYLIGLGHRRIGFVTGDPRYDVSRRRQAGFEDAMAAADLSNAAKIVRGEFSYESGLIAAETLLSQDIPPSAIFAANDEMASACLAAAYKHNFRVPDDLSVVGFDDSPIARAIYPALTTIRQGAQDLVGAAVEMLSERLSGDASYPHDITFAHSLVVRDSAGPPKMQKKQD